MPQSSKRLKALEKQAAPALASQWIYRQFQEEHPNSLLLAALAWLHNGEALAPVDEVADKCLKDYLDPTIHPERWENEPAVQGDELTITGERAVTLTALAMYEALSIVPREYLAPNYKDRASLMMCVFLSLVRPDIKAMSNDVGKVKAYELTRDCYNFTQALPKCSEDVFNARAVDFVKGWQTDGNRH